jgi:hypothetical protein
MAAASQVAKKTAGVGGMVRARLKARSAPTSEAAAPAAKARMTEMSSGSGRTGGMAANTRRMCWAVFSSAESEGVDFAQCKISHYNILFVFVNFYLNID